MKKIIGMSDTHGLHNEIENPIPSCDILIHAGDAMMYGESKRELSDFLDWYGAADAAIKIYVPGNHDGIVESNKELCHDMCKKAGVNLLIGETLEVSGLKIYGYPWTNKFMDWSFMLYSDEMEMFAKKIPKDTDILISHGPIYDHLDKINPDGDATLRDSSPLGSKELVPVIERIQPKHMFFGHIHGSYGKEVFGKTNLYNCSVCNEAYEPVNDFTVVREK